MTVSFGFKVKRRVPPGALDYLDPLPMAVAFDLKPQKAYEFFRDKGLKPTFNYYDMIGREHVKSFTTASLMDVQLLGTVADAVEDAISKGTSMADFRKELAPLLQRKGWWGRQQLTDPTTGQVVTKETGSAHRLNLIFRTNTMSAYNAGQWEQIQEQKEIAPYLMYDAVDDGRTRPDHAKFDRLVLKADDPFWNTHYPPNGYNCRCGAIQLTEDDLIDLGIQPSKSPKKEYYKYIDRKTGMEAITPVGTDPGFNYNAGDYKLWTKNANEYTQKHVRNLSAEMRAAYQVASAKQKKELQRVLLELKVTPEPEIITPPPKPEKATKAKKPQKDPDAWEKVEPETSDDYKVFVERGRETLKRLEKDRIGSLGMTFAEAIEELKSMAPQFKDSDIYSYPQAVLGQQISNHIVKRISETRGTRTFTKLKLKGAARPKAIVQAAAQRYPADWITDTENFTPEIRPHYSGKRGWAWTSSGNRDHGVKINGLTVDGPIKKNTGVIVTDDSSTAEHELGHINQAAKTDLDRKFNLLHEARTKSDKLEKLADLRPGWGYGKDEVTRKDGYYNPYQGREYQHKEKGYQAMEMLTMAFEPIIGHYEDNYRSKKTAENLINMKLMDPEMFELAIGLLFHHK